MTPKERAERIGGLSDFLVDAIARAIAEAEEAARVAEREACAAVADEFALRIVGECIRARGCTDDRCAIHGGGTMSEGSRCPTGDAAKGGT